MMHICLPLIQQFLDTLAGTAKATHIFSGKNVNVFAIFQDRNFNQWLTTLSFVANNFKF